MSCLSDLKPGDREYCEIQLALHEIFEIAQAHGLCEGIVQILISKFYGPIRKIQSSVFPVIKQWFINNSFREYQLLNPQEHNKLMDPNCQIQGAENYRTWFHNEEKKYSQRESVYAP